MTMIQNYTKFLFVKLKTYTSKDHYQKKKLRRKPTEWGSILVNYAFNERHTPRAYKESIHVSSEMASGPVSKSKRFEWVPLKKVYKRQ